MVSKAETTDTEKPKDGQSGIPPLLNRSLHKIIPEDEFLEPLRENAISLFRIASGLSVDRGTFSTRYYFTLMNEAEKLETFLDDYGARENATWHYFSELVASIRNFAIASFQLSHILYRYTDYNPAESENSSEEFIIHGLEALNYINSILENLVHNAIEELKFRGCIQCAPEVKSGAFKAVPKKLKLPRNLMEDGYKTSEERVMRIVESYRKIAIKIHRDRYGRRLDPEELAKMIPSRISETNIKILENSLHNIQSEYDTHVGRPIREQSEQNLINLRAYISIPMHLLEMARWLIHFYERHEKGIHSDESRKKIAKIVDKYIVLKLISHFSLFYVHKYIMAGKQVSEKIMSRIARKKRIKVPVPKPAGFHARPAYYITLVVEEHGTDIFMYVGDRKFDARSVLDLLEAGGRAADLRLEEVEFEGDERTLEDIKLLAECNYCEDDKIPKGLNYIRVARNIMT
ncbi:MAG: hypothetical protein IEMM0002_0149 [bacterium]|nr:MAG: hypothetical protein IEMM0002_0149 [bacterium]